MYSKYALLTKLVRSRWLDIGQVLFFCIFMDQDKVEIHKIAKKEQGQYPAILTEQAWSIKDLLYGQKVTPLKYLLQRAGECVHS